MTREIDEMTDDAILKITPDMSEDEIFEACAEAVLSESPASVRQQLDLAAAEQGRTSALQLIKAGMKEERAQYETIDAWLAALPGRLS